MKVYVVYYENWDTIGVLDICMTKEIAEKAIEEGKIDYPEDTFSIVETIIRES